MREVRKERTGWRDQNLSERHRIWGWDCPAVDLDFLFLEYDRGKAVAIVEYKHERAAIQHSIHPTYQAMKDLSDRANVPLIGCRYANDFSWFRATPLNHIDLFDSYEAILVRKVSIKYALHDKNMP